MILIFVVPHFMVENDDKHLEVFAKVSNFLNPKTHQLEALRNLAINVK